MNYLIALILIISNLTYNKPNEINLDFSNETIVFEVQSEAQLPIKLDDFDYLVRCVEAEAGNQDYYGKAYVCDVILNRMDYFSYKSYSDVINDKGQFECVSNGSINIVEPSEETYQVVMNELISRTNYDIMYFRTDKYNSFGKPVLTHGDHYFSSR